MLNLIPLLAAVDQPEIEMLKNSGKSSNPQIFGTDITIVLAVLLGIAAIIFFWAFFLRKKPTHARGSLVVQRADKGGREAHTPSGRRRRKRRTDHPSEWGRNPTLSETGGLPPPRPEEPHQPNAQQ